MIPFDFAYYKPVTKQEAVDLFYELNAEDKQPMYYAGGTEIISFARLNSIFTKAVIDIKAIPECNVLEFDRNSLIIGGAVTLTKIQEVNYFPLLSQAGGRVADHTTRGKITLGGNMLSRLPYREAILPLLAAESEIITLGRDGEKRQKINNLYQETLQLEPGELLLQVVTEKTSVEAPCLSLKKTSQGDVSYPQNKIGYPLMSLAALRKESRIRIAISGLCAYPFRSKELENALNEEESPDNRVQTALGCLPSGIVEDMEGSASYREYIFKDMLSQVLENLEG